MTLKVIKNDYIMTLLQVRSIIIIEMWSHAMVCIKRDPLPMKGRMMHTWLYVLLHVYIIIYIHVLTMSPKPVHCNVYTSQGVCVVLHCVCVCVCVCELMMWCNGLIEANASTLRTGRLRVQTFQFWRWRRSGGGGRPPSEPSRWEMSPALDVATGRRQSEV